MQIQPFYDAPTSTLTYLVYDEQTGDAVVIDPVLNYDPLASQTSTESVDTLSTAIREKNLRLHYVLETHAHADHLSGSQLLSARFGAKIAISRNITLVQQTFRGVFDLPADFPVDGSQFDELLEDGQQLRAGSLEIHVLATPGHTPACLSFRVEDAVFTGDALFIEDQGTGRCDFPLGSADELYRSIRERLYTLPDTTRVFVGHDYQPNGRELRFETSIKAEKASNVQLDGATTRAEFLEFRMHRDRQLAPPRLLYQSVQVNIDAGRLPGERHATARFLKLPLNRKQATDERGGNRA